MEEDRRAKFLLGEGAWCFPATPLVAVVCWLLNTPATR